MAETFVLDASAVIAVLRREKGSERVREVMDRAVMSSVNVAEARSKLFDYGLTAAELDHALLALGLKEVAFTPPQARMAGILRGSTRGAGLSIGDRACLALALEKGAVAITADSAWKRVDVAVQVEVIR